MNPFNNKTRVEQENGGENQGKNQLAEDVKSGNLKYISWCPETSDETCHQPNLLQSWWVSGVVVGAVF